MVKKNKVKKLTIKKLSSKLNQEIIKNRREIYKARQFMKRPNLTKKQKTDLKQIIIIRKKIIKLNLEKKRFLIDIISTILIMALGLSVISIAAVGGILNALIPFAGFESSILLIERLNKLILKQEKNI